MTRDQARFANRPQAALFLAGLSAFWGGFLILAVMLFNHDPRLGRHAQIGPGEVAAILLMAGGGIALTVVQLMIARRIGGGRVTMGLQVRVLMPDTIAGAARMVGLNGTVTASVLYAILIAGVLAFFRAVAP
jgi:hypothetical protein